jgi:hypothetical protein
MRRFSALVVGALVPAVLLAATAGARMQAPSGDTCTTSGTGTTFTLHVTIPASAQQYAIAFGAPGVTVKNAVIPGMNGNFSTQSLPANTSGAWVSDTPITGSPSVSLTTSGTATGPFTIVPAGAQSAYFNAVTCTVAQPTPRPTIAFKVAHLATYSAAAHAWHLVVTIPAPGTVSARQPVPTIGTGSSKPVTFKPLVQVRPMVLKTGGRVTLTLRPTSRGQAALETSGRVKLSLRVKFNAEAGQTASKLLSLTLRT